MFILYPNYHFHRIFDIPAEFFVTRGITTLLLDIDNTLTTDNNPQPHEEVLCWLQAMHDAGMRLMLLSNNLRSRVEPFAALLGLEFIANACKPSPHNLKKALASLGVPLTKAAVIGDQLFTDILCGRLAGCTAIFVEPMELERYGFYRVKRCLERPVLRCYRNYLKSTEGRN
ncbi:MAG: YqeG family HAD IIIA-type phosphatase [Angelakisella sp.]